MNRSVPELSPGRRRRALITVLPWAFLVAMGSPAAQTPPITFDHRHGTWDAQLKQFVVVAPARARCAPAGIRCDSDALIKVE